MNFVSLTNKRYCWKSIRVVGELECNPDRSDELHFMWRRTARMALRSIRSVHVQPYQHQRGTAVVAAHHLWLCNNGCHIYRLRSLNKVVLRGGGSGVRSTMASTSIRRWSSLPRRTRSPPETPIFFAVMSSDRYVHCLTDSIAPPTPEVVPLRPRLRLQWLTIPTGACEVIVSVSPDNSIYKHGAHAVLTW
jgi:hypothetical protein